MSENRNRRHIPVPTSFRSFQDYKPHSRDFKTKPIPIPTGGRASHASALSMAIKNAADDVIDERKNAAVTVADALPGLYLEFESFPGLDLALQSMEKRDTKDSKRHIELVAAKKESANPEGAKVQCATIFVPETEIGHFLDQLDRYANPSPKKKGERRHEKVYDRIASIRKAVLQALWTDDPEFYPSADTDKMWWEVWLRRTDGKERERLSEFCKQVGAEVGERHIEFVDRIVTLVFTSAHLLSSSLSVMGDIAELQRAKETASFFVKFKSIDQADWVRDLFRRTTATDINSDSAFVCLLDTGVNRTHPLLQDSLAPEDLHTCDPNWGVDDNGGGPRMEGHGTEMAGLALYGDLTEALISEDSVSLKHRLESVKLLPPRGQTAPELYASITAEAISRPEIQAPHRRRIFSMAITAKDGRDRGQPTSWSAAVDAISAGRSFDASDKGLKYFDEDDDPLFRLFVLSAGNVDQLDMDHVSRSDVEPVHDPGQAWNALTVGAYTEKYTIREPDWAGWTPVAEPGDLCPWSTTSVSFQATWPIKPDVVFEGGNPVHDGKNVDYPCDDLSLLTTYYKPREKELVTTWATSASCALAARFCASISAEYPELWPETVRALTVHSARWTPSMLGHFDSARGKTQRGVLVRRYGYGVPDLERAIRSASNQVTLMIEDTIRPFREGKLAEIHFHDLPWPQEVLSSLGELSTRVRVTLSYFIEPNPGRRGWQTKHRYQSHGLRFELKGPTEKAVDFKKRLNKKALDSDESKPSTGSANDGWYLGPNARDKGSIHSDVLETTAADLAERGMLAVYPVTGWWKEQKKRDRSHLGARYALLVSIETDATEADLWTPIALKVGLQIAV